jgi:hypothetical protein
LAKKKPKSLRAGKVKCSRCHEKFIREKGTKVKLCLHCQLHCYRCNVKLTPSTISLTRGSPKCTECEEDLDKLTTKAKSRDYQLVKRYGITFHEYLDIVGFQQGQCYICKKLPTINSLSLDHKHEPGEKQKLSHMVRVRVRGALCYQCNKGLAFYRDNSEYFQRAAEYLLDPPAQKILKGRTNV